MPEERRKPPKEFIESFGEAIKDLRGRVGLSQEQLALEANLHRTYVSDIERGARNPTVAVIKVLADALKTVPSELFRMAREFANSDLFPRYHLDGRKLSLKCLDGSIRQRISLPVPEILGDMYFAEIVEILQEPNQHHRILDLRPITYRHLGADRRAYRR